MSSIRQKVIAHIQATQSSRFRVVDNTGPDKKVIAGQFPDLLLYFKDKPLENTLLFIMKVENGGDLVDSLPVWKELGTAQVGFYIIVPKLKLDEAKKLASATGVKARFGSYEETDQGSIDIHYE